MAKIALYLSGGGARGAYQAGALKAIGEILNTKTLPFNIISGTSVGTINAAILCEQADDFIFAVEKIVNLWENIQCDDIFYAQNYNLGRSLLHNLMHFFILKPRPTHLLETKPLHNFLHQHIDLSRVRQNMNNGYFDSLEVITHCYDSGKTISFYEAKATQEPWNSSRHICQRTTISAKHILASSAMPIFFPVTLIDKKHYGDGAIGLMSPLRGAIRFNADKIFIISSQHQRVFDNVDKLKSKDIGFAHILGSLLSNLFVDNLNRDIELISRINQMISLYPLPEKKNFSWRSIQTYAVRPTQDLAKIAQADYHVLPKLLKLLLNLLGTQSGELLSFLLFESTYTRELIQLGYQDTICQADSIRRFFAD